MLKKVMVMGLSIVLFVLLYSFAFAFSGGQINYSGNPEHNGGLTCNNCHSGGVVPDVVLEGPTAVDPGQWLTYTLTISGGQEVAGGLNVSATGGVLTTTTSATDTQILFDQLTHTMPKSVAENGSVSFTFRWQAPITPSTVTLYGAGNSVNLMDATSGDAANNDALTIQVGNVIFLPMVQRP